MCEKSGEQLEPGRGGRGQMQEKRQLHLSSWPGVGCAPPSPEPGPPGQGRSKEASRRGLPKAGCDRVDEPSKAKPAESQACALCTVLSCLLQADP